MKYIINNQNTIIIFLFVIMSGMMMVFYSPLCPGGDFYVHFNRLVSLMEAISLGEYPNYMDYNVINGYGYLINLFYSDFILLPFALIGLITTPVIAYQVMIFTLTLTCALASYWFIYKISENKFTATLVALLYTFSTYRIFDVYVRGALGEVMSFTVLPLVALGAFYIIKGNYRKWYILTIAYTLLIYSHLISTVLTSVVLGIFLLINYKAFKDEPKRIVYLFMSGLACIPLTAYYLFPMLEQMQSNTFYYQSDKLVEGVIGYRLNEVISGLFNGVSLRKETLFPKLGSLLTYIILTRVFITNKEKSPSLKFADTCTIVGILLLVMTTPLFPWKIPPFSWLGVIQFPWRLLEYATFLFAISGGYYLSRLLYTQKQKIVSVIGLCTIFIFIFNSDSIHYRTYICQDGKPEIDISTDFRGMIGGEYLPSKLPSNNFEYPIPGVYNDFIHQRGLSITKSDSTKVSNLSRNRGHLTFVVELAEKDVLELPITYYIGYRATLDGEQIDYQQSENGLMEIPIHKSGKIDVKYEGTAIQRVSIYITLISFIIFVVYIIYSNRRQKINKI